MLGLLRDLLLAKLTAAILPSLDDERQEEEEREVERKGETSLAAARRRSLTPHL